MTLEFGTKRNVQKYPGKKKLEEKIFWKKVNRKKLE